MPYQAVPRQINCDQRGSFDAEAAAQRAREQHAGS